MPGAKELDWISIGGCGACMWIKNGMGLQIRLEVALSHLCQYRSVDYRDMPYLFRIMPDCVIFPALLSCRDLCWLCLVSGARKWKS